MGIAGGFPPDGAKAESFGSVVACSPEPAIVEDQRFGAAALQKKLPVIRPGHGLPQKTKGPVFVKMRLERAEFGAVGHGAEPFWT